MSTFGKIFGTDKAIEKTVGYAKELIDEAWYTKEEKASDRAIAREKGQNMIVEWIGASTGSRLARRIIALGITTTWLFLTLLGAGVDVAAVWASTPDVVTQMKDTSTVLAARVTAMNGAVMLILGFYFAAPYMGELAASALRKFGKGANKAP